MGYSGIGIFCSTYITILMKLVLKSLLRRLWRTSDTTLIGQNLANMYPLLGPLGLGQAACQCQSPGTRPTKSKLWTGGCNPSRTPSQVASPFGEIRSWNPQFSSTTAISHPNVNSPSCLFSTSTSSSLSYTLLSEYQFTPAYGFPPRLFSTTCHR